jgi:hypothetical protein
MGRLVTRIVLPLTALVLGTIFFIFGVFSWQAPVLLRVEMLAGGGAAATTGFLTLYYGIRAHFSEDPQVRAGAAIRADMASGGMFILIGLLGVGAATANLQADFGPAAARNVKIAQVVRIASRGGRGADFRVEGERGWLQWRCHFDCAPRDGLLAVRKGPARITTIGNRLIGLESGGTSLLQIDDERQRLELSDGFLWAVCAAIALGATAYMVRRDRALRSLTPDPGMGQTVRAAWRDADRSRT